MPFNRIRGFYIRPIAPPETKPMSIEETNNKSNAAVTGPLKLLNVVIDQHEEALRAMTIFREVSYTYAKWSPDDRPDIEDARLLRMRKLNGTWRLCHGYYSSADPSGDIDWKPLADSSVTDRLRAVPQIDKLRQAIVDDKEKLSEEIGATFLSAIDSLEKYPDGAERAQAIRSAIKELEDGRRS